MKHTVEEFVLTNGSRGLLIHVPSASVVSFDFEFRAGNDYCLNDAIYETAHIMEHMVLQANKVYPKGRQFHAELEKNGAYSNATTDSASLRYIADCADFEWDRVFGLLELAITQPLFLAEEFKSECGNVREELTGRMNSNHLALWQQIAKASGEHFLTEAERLQNMSNVKLKDVTEHYLRTHTTDNLRFIIVGNLKGDRKEQIIQKLEGWRLPRGERFALEHEELVGCPTPIRIVRKEVKTIKFGLSIQANWRLPDNEADAMGALNHMLTGTLYSSILGRAREKGWAYDMWSSFTNGNSASTWDFGGDVSPKNASKLFEIICQEVKNVFAGGIAAQDIEAAKQFALGSHQMGCQTVGSIAGWYGRRYFFDGYVKDYANAPQAIAAVNKQTILKAAQDLIGGKRWAFGGLGTCTPTQLEALHAQFKELFT